MDDYVIKTATLIEWQKWLNQWKHDYRLEIIECYLTDAEATILLKRTKIKHN